MPGEIEKKSDTVEERICALGEAADAVWNSIHTLGWSADTLWEGALAVIDRRYRVLEAADGLGERADTL
jgi:hypothetical protein